MGTIGVVSPDSLTTIRRVYFAAPLSLYLVAGLRVLLGIAVVFAAKTSRAPRTLRLVGAILCLQGVAAAVLGPDNARAILEWEAVQGSSALRFGGAAAVATGGFVVFAIAGSRPKSQSV